MAEQVAASTMEPAPTARPAGVLAPDTYERMLAAGAALMLAAVLLAMARGQAEWHKVPPIIWAHLATIVIALGLTPVMLLRRRGDARHRLLGWIWSGSMTLTAALSLGIKLINHGGFSVIHVLSIWTLIQVPVIVLTARSHNLKRHRRAVRGMVTGAPLIAGFFTFPFGRLLGTWLLG